MATTGFALIGTIYYLWMVYQDHKNNMWVDDRKNYFMLGIAMSLTWTIQNPLWWILANIAVAIILRKLLVKFNVVGEADVSALTWSFIGLGIIGIGPLFFYVLFLALGTIIYHLTKHLMKIRKDTPFMLVLAVSFVLSCVMYKLY